jgi:hypothetical protein
VLTTIADAAPKMLRANCARVRCFAMTLSSAPVVIASVAQWFRRVDPVSRLMVLWLTLQDRAIRPRNSFQGKGLLPSGDIALRSARVYREERAPSCAGSRSAGGPLFIEVIK